MGLCVIGIHGLSAQEDEAWYIDKPIVDFEFRGLEVTSERDVRPIVEPYINQEFSATLLEEVQRRLYALDFFAEIIPLAEDANPTLNAQQAVTIVFNVRENPLVESVSFDGNRHLSDAILRDEILLKRSDILTLVKLRADINTLVDFYNSRGFPNAEIDYVIENVNESGTRQSITFNITENEQLVVRSVEFSGNGIINDAVLRGVMNTKAQSLFDRGELDRLGSGTR